MALKHAFTSGKTDGTDATLVQPSNWNADHVIDTDGATATTRTDAPAAPAAGNIVIFGKTIGGGALPAFVGPSGEDSALQPFIGRNKIGVWTPLGNSTLTNGAFYGIPLWSSLGTATARAVATTNLLTSLRRTGYVTATTANSRALIYDNVPKWFLGAAATMGGFRSVFRFGVSDAVAVSGATTFVGMSAASTVTNGADPSAAVNIIGVGSDAADTNMQVMHNDGAGTATKIDLGVNFPANTASADVYELAIYVPPNSTTVGYQVTRLNTGDMASGSITTDLPATNTLLLPMFVRNSGSTAGSAAGIDMVGLYIETDN